MQEILVGTAEIEDLPSLLTKIKDLNDENNVVQAINTENLSSIKQLQYADHEANWAFKNKRNIAKDLNTEFLIRLAGQRQIKKALNDFGLKQGKQNIAIYCSGPNAVKNADALAEHLMLIVADTVLDLTPKKKKQLMKHYSITTKALETINSLDELVLEKISLIGLSE